MDRIRKIPKKFTKKSGNKVINRQYFRRKTELKSQIIKTNNFVSKKICKSNQSTAKCSQFMHIIEKKLKFSSI